MSLVIVLVSLYGDLLLLAMKRSALYKAFFNAMPHISVLVQLNLVLFAFRSLVMIIYPLIFRCYLAVVLIVDAGGI